MTIRLPLPCLAVFACAALGPPTALAADWTAVSLHPPGALSSQVHGISGGTQVGTHVFVTDPPTYFQPTIWHGSAQSWMTLSPTTADGGGLRATWGGLQGGDFNGGAAIWAGTPESRVDLHPAGRYISTVYALSGSMQVGTATANQGGSPQAAMWSGSAASYTSLHPPGSPVPYSYAYATDGVLQGGQAHGRPVLWAGSAQSLVDLTPPQGHTGTVYGMVVGQQVGYASIIGGLGANAAMWNGSAATFTNLNPPGAGISRLHATCGIAQAGYANVVGYGITAGVWYGTPESFVPLAPYLPPGFIDSIATSITIHEGQLHVGGYAFDTTTGYHHAFLWIGPIPAPGALPLLASAALLAARRKRA